MLGHANTTITEDVYIDDQNDVIDLSSIMNSYSKTIFSKIQESDNKIVSEVVLRKIPLLQCGSYYIQR